MLLALPVVCLLQEPERLPSWATALAAAPGWTAILLAVVAAAWYLRQVSPRDLVHVPGSLTLALGVLAACAVRGGKGDSPHLCAAPFGPFRQMGTVPFSRPWLSYHVLTAAWAAAGLAVLGIGWAGRKLRLAGQVDPALAVGPSATKTLFQDRSVATGTNAHPTADVGWAFMPDRGSQGFETASQPILSGRAIESWVTLIGVLTVVLALCYAAADTAAPWWSFGALLMVSLTFGLLAVWRRRPALVYASGLLANVAATVVWVAWWRFDPVRLVEINVVALSAAALAWSLVRPFIPADDRRAASVGRIGNPSGKEADILDGLPIRPTGTPAGFAPWAAQAGLVLLGLLVWTLLVCDLLEIAHPAIGRLGGISLAASLLSIAACLGDRTSRFVLAGLYGWALTATGLGLAVLSLKPDPLCWTAGLALALFVLAMAIAGKPWAGRKGTRHAPRDARPHAEREEYLELERFAMSWFSPVQMTLAALAAPLAVWVAIDGRFDSVTLPGMSWPAGRMTGALSVLALLVAGILMPGRSDEKNGGRWQYVTLGLGMLLLATSGWARLGAATPAPWLHGCVILMASAVLMSLVGGLGLARLLPSGSDWIARGRAGFAVVRRTGGGDAGGRAGPRGIPPATGRSGLYDAAGGDRRGPRAGGDVGCVGEHGRGARLGPAETLRSAADRLRLCGRGGAGVVRTAPLAHRAATVPVGDRRPLLDVPGAGDRLRGCRAGRVVPAAASAGAQRAAGADGRTAADRPGRRLLVCGRSSGRPAVGRGQPAALVPGAVLHGALAARRRSLGHGLLAAAAANVGLGVLWQRFEWGLLEHPQLWLIPWGLTILAAEFINHKRLAASLSTGLRYLGLSLIYIPSSAEFLRDLGQSVWLPLVLVSLSLLGMLAGILLRIRSFLFLGLSFLLVVIVTMIKYAAVDLQHTWVFFVACIILGTIVIGSVAFYEKRRTDLATVVRNLKQWQR